MENSYTAFAAFYDAMMHDVDYDAWAQRLAQLIGKSFSCNQETTIADCACGTGAISIRLAEKGYTVTGIDLSADMLMQARNNAMQQGIRMPFIQQDIANLAVHKPVKVINCSCDGVNYLTSRERMLRFFQSAHAALQPDGILLFDVSTRYKLSTVLGSHCFGEDLAACTYLWENAYDPQSKLIEMRLHVFYPDGKGHYSRFDETHIQRAHSDREIRSTLMEAGFASVESFDGLSENLLTDTSERALYVCHRN